MTTTISLLNMKGGVGKTTLAVNLGWHFYEKENKSVLLVDLDPQFNSTQFLMDFTTFDVHRKKNGTITNLLVDQPTLNLKDSAPKKNPSSVLHRVAKGGSKRFDLLPAELSLNFVVKNPGSMDYRLEKLLENIRTKYEYVFIDCAPTDSVLTTMALTASDYILIPMKPDRYSILGFTNLMETMKNFRTGSHDPHSVKMAGVVFTQVHDDSSVEKKAMDEVSKVAKDAKVPLFTSFLPFSPSFMRSVEDQTPIYKTYKAKPRIRKAIASVAAEMVSEIAAINAAKTTAAGQIPAKKAKKS